MANTQRQKFSRSFWSKITAQLNTFHYTVIDRIPDVQKQQAMDNFSAMRTALASGTIDGYVSERPEGVTATSVNKDLEMLGIQRCRWLPDKPGRCSDFCWYA